MPVPAEGVPLRLRERIRVQVLRPDSDFTIRDTRDVCGDGPGYHANRLVVRAGHTSLNRLDSSQRVRKRIVVSPVSVLRTNETS